ncbi:MAG: flavin monoamine oxidase family protein [Fimbriimonas sp.]
MSGAAVLVGCAGSGDESVPIPGGDLDVLIIGAGMSGLAAGQALKATGRKFAIIDAQTYAGGRALTDNSFPVPFDHGAQWFVHVIPDGPGKTLNPLFDIANRQGVQTVLDVLPRYVYDGTMRLPDEDFLPAAELLVGAGTLFESAGLKASLGAADISIAEAIQPLAGQQWFNLISGAIASERGVALDKISCEDIYKYDINDTVPFGLPSTESYLVPGGMGNFVQSFATGLPIQYATAATSIKWDGPGGVEVQTTSGKITAKTVIITCSAMVINDGLITFTPSLPAEYTDAYAGLTMGSFAKIGLAFDKDVFGGVGMSYALPLEDSADVASIIVNVFGANQCSILLGGAKAAELEVMGNQALIDYGIEKVVELFGTDARTSVTQSAVVPWKMQEFIRGVASVALPGKANGRLTLMKPLHDRVFFAGEAVSEFNAGALIGAYESGRAAVEKALKVI